VEIRGARIRAHASESECAIHYTTAPHVTVKFVALLHVFPLVLNSAYFYGRTYRPTWHNRLQVDLMVNLLCDCRFTAHQRKIGLAELCHSAREVPTPAVEVKRANKVCLFSSIGPLMAVMMGRLMWKCCLCRVVFYFCVFFI